MGRRPTINFAVTNEELETVTAIAKERGVTKSDIVRTALTGWLKRNKPNRLSKEQS